jgi:hypothetical protein
LRSEKSRITDLLAKNDSEIINEAFMLCLSRLPQPLESKRLQKLLAETPKPGRREIVEDLFWALMTSREFLFQH